MKTGRIGTALQDCEIRILNKSPIVIFQEVINLIVIIRVHLKGGLQLDPLEIETALARRLRWGWSSRLVLASCGKSRPPSPGLHAGHKFFNSEFRFAFIH